MANFELWGGVECTVNRVGEQYFDQMEKNGHALRLSDLELFADLGLKKIRYPVLWEHVAPEHPEQQDWTWATERLNKLRELSIEPIVGLLHHGSGPRYTNLLDEDFPQKLAHYAKSVAQQFPWVEYYTPINEPLTTARFSALYGHWYPHAKSDAAFAKALLNEVKGTQLAMQAIREINPNAKLVQTEDLGYTHSTRTLKYQAKFENNRRWLTWDLLSGKVDEQHPLWKYLRKAKVPASTLLDLVANPCPPNVIGVNYYVTSERYLDERLKHYPLHTHGSNGKHRYADVEAVRVAEANSLGVQGLLEQVCERYPDAEVAITEAHLCCTREEQMRWLAEVWDSALFLQKQGKNVIAVTLWSLLGSYDWNSLLTEARGFYEPGIFDLRSGSPVPTACVPWVKALVNGEERHPVLQSPGWWKTHNRVEYPAVMPYKELWRMAKDNAGNGPKPLLITGETGTLGKAFARVCELRSVPYLLTSRAEMDVSDPESIEQALQAYQPWAVINTAGYVRVDEAEKEADACYKANTEGAELLAKACQAKGVGFVTFSSDLVFDGEKAEPYLEDDQPNPLNVYGRSKALAEEAVLKAKPDALVIRTSAFFGPWDEYNFVHFALQAFAQQEAFKAAKDVFITPTYVPDLVNASLDLLMDGAKGIYHLANQGVYSWAEFAELAAKVAGMDAAPYLQPVPQDTFDWPATRPAYTALGTSRGIKLPALEDALRRFCRDRESNSAITLADSKEAVQAASIAS